MNNELHIVHLYPNEMNTYGDRGNIMTLAWRARQHGLEPIVHHYHPGESFPEKADIVFGGGGQDSAQSVIQQDVLRIGDKLKTLADQGVPMLMICGMYQLFGHRFITHDTEEIKGIGLLDIETRGTKQRLIGNVAVQTDEFDILYGFENHSGQTYVLDQSQTFGTSIRGHGNNADDKTGGARKANVIGCYIHGPVLPLNPKLTDWLIATGATNAHGSFTPKSIDDLYVDQARSAAMARAY